MDSNSQQVNSAYVQQADAARIKEAQEYREAQAKAAEAAAEAGRIAEEQKRARIAAEIGHAARVGWSSQHR